MFTKKKKIVTAVSVSLAACIVVASVCGIAVYRDSSRAYIKNYTKGKEGIVLTVGYVKDGKTVVKKYGENGEKLTDGEVLWYEIGSVSKTFTGNLVGKAIAEEKLTLDSRVGEFIPLTSAYDPTVRELATHASAYGNYAPSNTAEEMENSRSNNPMYGIMDKDIVEQMNAFATDTVPPYETVYSNFGISVLGVLLETVYGKPLMELMQEQFDELGLENTGVNYNTTYNGGWRWTEDDAYIAAGGLSSTVYDMLRYGQSVCGETSEALKIATTPIGSFGDSEIGLAWQISDGRYFGHGGATQHFNCMVYTDRKTQTTVAVLSNYPVGEGKNTSHIAKKIMKEIT